MKRFEFYVWILSEIKKIYKKNIYFLLDLGFIYINIILYEI